MESALEPRGCHTAGPCPWALLPGSSEETGQTALSPGAGIDVIVVTGPGLGEVPLPQIWPLIPDHSPLTPAAPRPALGQA